MPEATSQFAQTHSFVSGAILIALGLAGVVGSISGNLAAMISALVDPTNLYSTTETTQSAPAVTVPDVPGIPGSGSPLSTALQATTGF